VSLDEQPALLALRQVSTPAVALTQGFVIRREELQRLLEDSPYPVRLKPGPPSGETEARIPIDGEPWTVVLDVSAATAAARARADSVRARFRANFAGGLLAALVAGALVVGLVRQADRLAQQRARFAAAAAHELRTPLAGLRMYGEMLADESGDPAQHQNYAQRIACEAERLGRVVANLLGFSKLERGELKLHAAAGDLGATIRESLGRLRPALEAGGVRVEESISDTLPPVRFDRDAVHQILQNLLDNAARYGKSATDRTIRVVVDQGPVGANLSVVDRGPGVEPSLKGKLFQAFARHPSPDAPDGLGLGLALVQALARAQDASVAYIDEAGGGSRFTVTFSSSREQT
jgi:two-component system phosphate regulon sensor histidine kinase PhoR